MLRFLFWNLARRPLADRLAVLARDHKLDFLILVECEIPSDAILREFGIFGLKYNEAVGIPRPLAVFTSFEPECLKPRLDSQARRLTVREFVHPDHPKILIAVAHLSSQLYRTPDSLTFQCVSLGRTIRQQEQAAGHNMTLLVGDLNLNPFDHGVVGTGGLHAVMTRDLASRQVRTIKGEDYPLFYNPMWSHFGDRSTGPSGTYFYERSVEVEYLWNIFDQLLLRPPLAARFDPIKLKIVTQIGNRSLVGKNGRPNIISGLALITFR